VAWARRTEKSKQRIRRKEKERLRSLRGGRKGKKREGKKGEKAFLLWCRYEEGDVTSPLPAQLRLLKKIAKRHRTRDGEGRKKKRGEAEKKRL